jgi:undecaprenyl-diphosphatase
MSLLQAVLLAAIQGVTELFPVSSLAHAVILPRLFGWPIDQKAPEFLPFLVVLHLGTASALLIYFWRDWIGLAQGLLGASAPSERSGSRRLLAMIVIGTIPAAIIGKVLEAPLRGLFGSPAVAAAFLIANGVVLLVAERLRRNAGRQSVENLSWGQALFIGLCQCGALIPGFSRSGLTMGAGLASGLSHADSARFSFLLATPIIAGAGVLELPKLLHAGAESSISLAIALIAGAVAAVTAFASTAFLMRFFRRHDLQALNPFAYYCLAGGAIALLLLVYVV